MVSAIDATPVIPLQFKDRFLLKPQRFNTISTINRTSPKWHLQPALTQVIHHKMLLIKLFSQVSKLHFPDESYSMASVQFSFSGENKSEALPSLGHDSTVHLKQLQVLILLFWDCSPRKNVMRLIPSIIAQLPNSSPSSAVSICFHLLPFFSAFLAEIPSLTIEQAAGAVLPGFLFWSMLRNRTRVRKSKRDEPVSTTRQWDSLV